ncbi:UDP-N-acetylglucosamine pyrophosphorylase /glucosamine-1-phosphate N-acetyltransferase [Sinobacterium caligoides]|uniref:Bifunctional protein GlmU n=1 Tax=Sinobacterium caligoides TaxID=933926 RepID=A0A3N2DGW7_9GAMM|nr:UDP-N-acetylglucosamine pyrophosphorylase /glucosamine-1-phosphate N-acetyltransferase [Sinobacterium caligoides]
MNLQIVILAAGQGTRMKSTKPKVLHPVAGKPMVGHVIDTCKLIGANKMAVVIGHGADQVRQQFASEVSLEWVEQLEQLGTGHAVQMAEPNLDDDAVVLICYGDSPLIEADTFQQLIKDVSDNSMALLTVEMPDPTGYGRIIRDDSANVIAIVEQKDADEQQRLVSEVNTGVMAVAAKHLKQWLPQLSNDNAQGEYYLTDVIALAAENGVTVIASQPASVDEVMGANNRVQLAELERCYQRQQVQRLMLNGATLLDPARVDIRGELATGRDVSIDINCVFVGKVTIGDNVVIEPNCFISDSEIGDNTVIKANSVLEQAVVAEGCDIGPFARLRPGTVLANKAKIGNFVETKKAIIGEGSKVNHLSYIGDCEVGIGANIGAGTITCNYDGVNKSKTEIGDGAFIGSNSSLVAPVKVGDGATVGAGATVTSDVAAGELAVARAKQRNIAGWKRPVKK